MSATSSSSSSGIGLVGAVFIVFLVLKLTGTIDWSWWWVTAPLWGSVALFLAALAVFIPIALTSHKRWDKKWGPKGPLA